ncbi:hypothetical protein [Noviherbaspirillum sp.]|uniref:hypothetical protein n=1 Tax=Noviherbaspirillum sp. TaxID=1926288 RepID=UPI002D761E40|nr:hypothetical protein [Noviherbaspirillum sp.]HZW21366.1 hypothetical protein [Noviherbaspirillum sp.]
MARPVLLVAAVLLAACAGPRPHAYSDAANAQERKAYVTCAVTRAFLHADQEAAPEEVAHDAMRQCGREREAVMRKLVEENADKPFGMSFVASYMDALHASMREHIALRLSQARARGHGKHGVGT